MEPHQARFVLIFMVLFSVAYATNEQCAAIINFGDSNSDTGSNAAAFGYKNPPYGETYFGSPSKRISDGRVIIDFMAESMGFPYLSSAVDSLGANYTHGVNFATSGATIRYKADYSPFWLVPQYNQFTSFLSGLNVFSKQNVFKEILLKPEDISRALFTIDIGQNDLTADNYFNTTTMSPEQRNANLTAIIDQWIEIVQLLYNKGGRFFWIHNTGPHGCLPGLVSWFPVPNPQGDSAGCWITSNELSQDFNRRLKEAVVQLRKQFPLATFTYVDIYAAKYKLISEAKLHGFENPLRACCGHGGGLCNINHQAGCGDTFVENGKPVLVGKCKDPSTSINWDGTHYTEAANRWVFNQIASGAYSDPPTPLNKACAPPRQEQNTEL